MSVTAKMVKALRDKTGAGIMDAKRALVANDGDIEASVDWLRAKGMSKAAKMSTRTAADGLIAVSVSEGVGAMVEVNSETDFVAKNAEFCTLVGSIADCAIGADGLEDLLEADIEGKSAALRLQEGIATLGENLTLRRMAKVSGESIASYVHSSVSPGMGKIGVLVAMNGVDTGIGKQVAMHVAASSPLSLSEADMPADRLVRERQVLIQKAHELRKPAAIIERIVVGGIRKFVGENALLQQSFVIDPDKCVGDAAQSAGVEVTGFVRFAIGGN
ncbi:MAG: translation elongation factor Ts [Rhodobacteraceae bacterium]|nr:translation elongation factor Ts [Paracoccaceae bacterium]